MSACRERDVTEQFRFERPPLVTVPLVFAFAGALTGLLGPWIAHVLFDAPPSLPLPLIAVVLTAFTALVLGARALLRPRSGATIALPDEHAVLPLSPASRRSRRVGYEQITSLNVFGRGRRARMLVATPWRNFVYPVERFEGRAEDVAALREALRARIADRPGGAARLSEIERRDAHGTELAAKPPYVTVTLLAVLAAAYVWSWARGGLEGPSGSSRTGRTRPCSSPTANGIDCWRQTSCI